MPIVYRYEEGVIITEASGVVDDAMAAAHAHALLADPHHSPSVPELLDLRKVADLRVTGEGARRVADLLRHQPGEAATRVAILIADKAAFGMARMYQLLRDDIQVGIFEDHDSAIGWLREPASDKP